MRTARTEYAVALLLEIAMLGSMLQAFSHRRLMMPDNVVRIVDQGQRERKRWQTESSDAGVCKVRLLASRQGCRRNQGDGHRVSRQCSAGLFFRKQLSKRGQHFDRWPQPSIDCQDAAGCLITCR